MMFDLNGVAEILVPLAAIICLFGLPVLAFVVFRLLSHRERMEMIRNGMMPAAPAAREWRASSRPEKRASAGCGDNTPDSAQNTLRKGISLTFIGFAITLGLSFIGYDDNKWSFGPWLLGGLIPMFVGLAQVTIALLSGATLGSARRTTEATYYGGMPPQPPSGSVPDFDSPYTYRPGPTQELRPPASPPERRS